MALIRPIVPTWTTSSIGSLRLRNRAAAYRTSGRLISISAARTRRCSGVPGSSPDSSSNSTWVSARASAARRLREDCSAVGGAAGGAVGAGGVVGVEAGAVPADNDTHHPSWATLIRQKRS